MINSEEKEGEFLRDLFAAFEEADVGYCVLRNYTTLPDSFGGSDLDLAVLPEEKEQVADVVLSVAMLHGGVPIVDYVSSGRFIRILGGDDSSWWGAAIDLFWMMEYRGVEYISSQAVIERAKDYRGLKVARDDDAASIALVKELLSNGKTRKDYFPQLAAIYNSFGSDTLDLLEPTFSQESIQHLGEILSQGKDQPDVIKDLSERLRRDVFKNGSGSKTEGRIRNLIYRLHRVIKPAGFSIAVLGTDGSGKTTLIDYIRPVLEKAIHNTLDYQHLRPNWLPALGVATGKREAGDGSVVTDPHAQSASGFVGSLVRLTYYTLDYTLGYWRKIYPRLIKRPHICLFDRYYYDIITDPRRMRMALPSWVMKLAFKLAPRPQLILCLGADPKVIYSRKPETSLEEVGRQVQALKDLCKNDDRAFWVDTGKTIDESAHDMLHLIRGAMSSRYR